MATKSTYKFIAVRTNADKFERELEETARDGWVIDRYSQAKTENGGSTYAVVMVRADAEHV